MQYLTYVFVKNDNSWLNFNHKLNVHPYRFRCLY